MWGPNDIIESLKVKGELRVVAPGVTLLRGDVATLFQRLKCAIATLCEIENPEEWHVPPAVDFATLARAEYFASFPQWLTVASHLTDDEDALCQLAGAQDPARALSDATSTPKVALNSAVCYHVYRTLADTTIEQTRLVTAQSECWRHEGARHALLERGWAFTMRELVCISSEDEARAFLESMRQRVTDFARVLDLQPVVDVATDPFFAPTARAKHLLQGLKELKRELLLLIESDRRIAASSFNLHDTFFGEAFGIRLPNGKPATTACVAFGVERWLLAFLVRHGLDADHWPEIAGRGARGAGGSPLSCESSAHPASHLPRSAPRAPQPLYVRHAHAADRGAWSLERDIRWDQIDRNQALAQPDILAKLRDAALIESFHPVNLSRLIRFAWDDVDAGVVFSLEMYEGFKHFHALRTYLEAIDYEPAITDEELRRIRERADRGDLDANDQVSPLVEFMLSEHLAAYFFRRLGEQAREPQLRALLALIAADEVRHAQAASDLIAKRIAGHPEWVPNVMRAAVQFRHYGEEAVGEVPVALEGDEVAIRTFATRIQRLCGMRLVDHLKLELER